MEILVGVTSCRGEGVAGVYNSCRKEEDLDLTNMPVRKESSTRYGKYNYSPIHFDSPSGFVFPFDKTKIYHVPLVLSTSTWPFMLYLLRGYPELVYLDKKIYFEIILLVTQKLHFVCLH